MIRSVKYIFFIIFFFIVSPAYSASFKTKEKVMNPWTHKLQWIFPTFSSLTDTPNTIDTGAVLFIGSDSEITGDTSKMFINTTSGNVGIGTSTPGTTLEVIGVVTSDGLILSDGECVGLDCSAKGRIEFEDEATDNINLMNANVGIGTTNPSSVLEVLNTGGINDKVVIIRGVDSQNANLQEWQNNSGTALATIQSDGAIGGAKIIGGSTTALIGAAQFEIQRAGNPIGVFINTNAAAVGNGGFFTFYAKDDGGGNSPIAEFGGRTEVKHATDPGGALVFETTATGGSLAIKMVLDEDGNLGIGTTAPAKLLHVLETTGIPLRLEDSDGTVDFQILSGPRLVVQLGGTNSLELSTSLIDSGTGTGGGLFTGNDGADIVNLKPDRGDTNTGIGSRAADTLDFITAGSTALHIDSSQNVGIGTTAPTAQLHTTKGRIVNTTRITSNTTLDATHHNVFGDTDGGEFTVTFPTGVDGTYYRVVNTGTSGNNLLITPDTGQLLIGVSNFFNLGDGESLISVFETTEGWN